MKNIISLVLFMVVLSGCSYLRVHKQDIEQGNIISSEHASQLHRGMSQEQVKNIMGTPLLVNVFSPGIVAYIYTFQKGYGDRQATRITCYFRHGQLVDISHG